MVWGALYRLFERKRRRDGELETAIANRGWVKWFCRCRARVEILTK